MGCRAPFDIGVWRIRDGQGGFHFHGDEASSKATVDELIKPKVAQYSGRIVKLMGDGVLMEFACVNNAVSFAV